MAASQEQQAVEVAGAFEALHGAVIGRVLPKLAGTMHGRDLSFSQLTTIMSVFVRGPMSIAEIAGTADITHTAASRMVDRLVKAGFMTRTEDPSDRRQKLVNLTPAGTMIPPEWRAFTLDAYVEVLRALPSDTFQELYDTVKRVADQIPPIPRAFYDPD